MFSIFSRKKQEPKLINLVIPKEKKRKIPKLIVPKVKNKKKIKLIPPNLLKSNKEKKKEEEKQNSQIITSNILFKEEIKNNEILEKKSTLKSNNNINKTEEEKNIEIENDLEEKKINIKEEKTINTIKEKEINSKEEKEINNNILEEEKKNSKEEEKETPILEGELDKILGIKISHIPISLHDKNPEKLNLKLEDLSPLKLYPKFYEKYIKNFKFPERKLDNYRPSYANNKNGGMDFPYEKTISMLRGMGWDIIKEIGRKILSGNFNLTQVTMPIKVMIPISILQNICYGHFNFPLYLNLASLTNDKIEKMKFTITATLSCWYRSTVILKPLNPILGETYEMIWEDGSHEYIEQTSHHPPCSNFILFGPNNLYIYSGYLNYTTHAYLNSLKLTNVGKRYVKFNDGTQIHFNYSIDNYSNTFFGIFRHESLGQMEFIDIENGIESKFTLGNDPNNKLSDCFIGEIKDKNGNVLSTFNGSYLSHIDFDGVRYWDIRNNIDIEGFPVKNQIPSSSIYRKDMMRLYERKMEEAQEEKIKLEELQRYDRKLREKFKKENDN